MKLSSKIVDVVAIDGKTKRARLYICTECGSGESFHIYLVGDVHQHIQCTKCSTSYCDGTCAGARGPFAPVNTALHRTHTQSQVNQCATCEGGKCPDCTDPAA